MLLWETAATRGVPCLAYCDAWASGPCQKRPPEHQDPLDPSEMFGVLQRL